jgi:hypothetical protein
VAEEKSAETGEKNREDCQLAALDREILMPFSDAAPQIQNADVLLFRGRGAFSDAIRASGRSLHSHAALAWVVTLNWEPWVGAIETVEGHGGRVMDLRQYVASYPGSVDVYRVCESGFDADAAVLSGLERIINRPYGKRRLLKTALQYIAVVRYWVQPSHDDLLPFSDNPFCSGAVSAMLRAGGWDPVKLLADEATTPGDLERADLRYLFTLTAEG